MADDLRWFSLSYRDDGVYMILESPPVPLDEGYIIALVTRKGLEKLDARELLSKLRKGDRSIRIAPPQDEQQVDEGVLITTSPDDMEAYLQLLPPDEGKARMTYGQLANALTTNKVIYGVDQAALKELHEAPEYGRKYRIASGTPAVNGVDASLEYHFELTRSNAPKVLEDGRVDYRELNLFTPVKAGQVLATLTPALPGQGGVNVRGETLAARKGKEMRMPGGQNTRLSEDGLQLLATADGHVDMLKGRVIVSDYYEVRDSVDMSTGNIDFAGDVIVRGNVISGMTVKAQGSIEVHGIVEAATLEAGGNIILMKGIQGMDKGKLRCEGDLIANFIERAYVYAVGKVTADAVLHSNVDCGLALSVLGKRGALIGGVVRSGEMVVVRHAGAVSQIATVIEVGVNPMHRQRQADLTKTLERIAIDLNKIERVTRSLPTENTEASKSLRLKLQASQRQLLEQQEDLEIELRELQHHMAQAMNGKVHVLEKAHSGVKIVIGNLSSLLQQSVDYATFKARDGQVTFAPCEYTP